MKVLHKHSALPTLYIKYYVLILRFLSVGH